MIEKSEKTRGRVNAVYLSDDDMVGIEILHSDLRTEVMMFAEFGADEAEHYAEALASYAKRARENYAAREADEKATPCAGCGFPIREYLSGWQHASKAQETMRDHDARP